MQSSFDRGFDRVQTRPNGTVHPLIDRSYSNGSSRRMPWKKYIAIGVVGVMVFAAGVTLLPAIAKNANEPARTLQLGQEVTYTVTNMFELYKKPQNDPPWSTYAELGRWNGTMGVNSWYDLRKVGYDEWIVRDSYPFVLSYNPYSTQTTAEVDAGNMVTSWYRLYIDAINVDGIGTEPGKDPLFVPILGNPSHPGGNLDIRYYSTYLTTQEMNDIRTNGNHYANTYYGVPTRKTPGPAADDGYWNELQGVITFDREAADRFLGLAAAGSLIDQFNLVELDIEALWMDDLIAEGSQGGAFDIYTAYDYPNDVRWVELEVDPNSTADSLVLRFWSVSWGNDVMPIRWMEAAGVWRFMQAWADDWYLNVTVGPAEGEIHSRSVQGYHLTAWKDASSFTGAWQLETVHLDWCGNTAFHTSYVSPYNPYDPDQTNGVVHQSWTPGSMNYGNRVSYWLAPQEWDLAAGETIIVEMPAADQPVLGVEPYQGTNDDLSDTKMQEYRDHMYWGELTVGNGWPLDLRDTYYTDPATRTLTLAGPLDFTPMMNPGTPTVLEFGSPTFMFDVAKVSSYDVAVTDPMPPELDPADYYSGFPYNAAVTARNQTGLVVTDWNGTVEVGSTDAGLLVGEVALPVQHTFLPADNGVWVTTFNYSTAGSQTVTVEDVDLGPDVSGSVTYLIGPLIPEFPTLLIPVIGAVALFTVLGKRSKRKKT